MSDRSKMFLGIERIKVKRGRGIPGIEAPGNEERRESGREKDEREKKSERKRERERER